MINSRTILRSLLFALLLSPCWTMAQSALHAFSLRQVQLLPGVFKDAQQTDMRYMLSLDPDRLLAPYLKEAGLQPKKENYGNWENTGLDGHIGGHYLSALSFMYAATGDTRLGTRLDYMLTELKRCQDKTGSGYLGGTPGGTQLWKEIAAGKIESDTFALNKKWVPLYNLHKLLAGLRDAYLAAGKTEAREILVRLTDYLEKVSSGLSDEQIQLMLVSEHGGLNEVFADVAAFTGDQKYAELARRFSHRQLLEPMMAHQDNMNGLHANMQIPKAVGFQRISEITGDTGYGNAARFFWQTVVNHRSVVIGGNSVGEHFNSPADYSAMIANIAGPETCNTYNMLKLTKHLFEQQGSLTYLNFYEKALYNHILSSQHPVSGGFVYYTPMRPRHYRVYSQAQECMWCCVGSGMENHGKYGELIYSYRGHDLYVNLFIPSSLTWQTEGISLMQQTKFPDEERTEIVITSAKSIHFTIYLRHPAWVKTGKLEISVNGKKEKVSGQPDSYIALTRTWKKGDKIEMHMPMKLSAEQLPDHSPYYAFLHGPIVLAAKTDTTERDNFSGDAEQFSGYRARGKQYPLDSMPLLVTKNGSDELVRYLQAVAGKPQTFVAPDLITPAAFKDLELIPFYKLHDARYIIYWRKQSEWYSLISSDTLVHDVFPAPIR